MQPQPPPQQQLHQQMQQQQLQSDLLTSPSFTVNAFKQYSAAGNVPPPTMKNPNSAFPSASSSTSTLFAPHTQKFGSDILNYNNSNNAFSGNLNTMAYSLSQMDTGGGGGSNAAYGQSIMGKRKASPADLPDLPAYLQAKTTVAAIMRDFTDNKIHFFGKDGHVIAMAE